MSTISRLTHNVRDNTKCYGLWRKTSTAKTAQGVTEHILSYLDETSKAEALAGSKRLGYKKAAKGTPVAQTAGIDYLSKEETGRVRAFGFLRDDITSMTGKYPHLLDNDTRVVACHSAWMQRILPRHVKKFGHKFVLSLDPRFCELMAAGGKDVDALLVQTSRTVLRRYQENYYPNDRLGYFLGVHHDRKHIHAHIMLFPFTEKGKNLNISNQGDVHRLTDMGRTANKLVQDYFSKEFEYPVRASERPIERTTQVRLLGLHLMASYKAQGLTEKECPTWIAREMKRLQALPEPELREILKKAYESEAVAQAKLTQALHKQPPEKLQAALHNLSSRQTGYKLRIQQVYKRTCNLNDRMTKLQSEMHSAYADMGNFKFYTANAKGCGIAVMELGSPEQRDWLNRALTGRNAETIRQALQERDQRLNPSSLQRDWVGLSIDSLVKKGYLLGPLDQLQQQANNRAIRNSQDFLRALFMERLEQLKAEREKIAKEQEANRHERDGLKIELDTIQLREIEVMAASKGCKPLFLEQYEGLKREGIDIPVNCRSLETKLMEQQAAAVSEMAQSGMDEINRRIIETLRSFQGDKNSEAMEVDRYFQTIIQATSAPPEKRSKPFADQLRRRQEEPEVKAFLRESGVPPQAPEPVEPTGRPPRQMGEREFEL